jgi:hypothetical protein
VKKRETMKKVTFLKKKSKEMVRVRSKRNVNRLSGALSQTEWGKL